jgi:gamma-glutamyltranspeptidase / glutathione hydrolase
LIKRASPNGFEVLKPDTNAGGGYRAPRAGELMKNPTLANTFKILSKQGKKGFYEGEIAKAIVEVVSNLGGHLGLEDLKEHGEKGSEETEPINIRFDAMNANSDHGGLDVWEHPPNGQGIIALMALGILQALYDKGKIEKWTVDKHNGVE